MSNGVGLVDRGDLIDAVKIVPITTIEALKTTSTCDNNLLLSFVGAV